MEYNFCYGTTTKKVVFPDEMLLDILLPNEISCTLTDKAEVERALCDPIGTCQLEKMVKKGNKVAIITSDITRPMPSHKVIPSILNRLSMAGIPDEDITIVFALGSHRKHTELEKRQLVGDAVYNRIRCEDSSSGEYIHLGKTSRGTPVTIAQTVAQADFRICLGNIEYHYFAGYSGGAKAIMPGVSNYTTILANHRQMTDPSARIGVNAGNVIREDIEECIRYCRVDFILNVILNENKEIIRAVAGDVLQAHREGCRFVDQLNMRRISSQADIVIASVGGYPKDINLYQAQKALENAAHAVKKGGAIILVAKCHEGFGNEVFENWLKEADSTEAILSRIQREFQLGGHKAVAIAKVAVNADIYLVSDLADAAVRQAFMIPAADIQSALERAMSKIRDTATLLLMPFAGSTLPRWEES